MSFQAKLKPKLCLLNCIPALRQDRQEHGGLPRPPERLQVARRHAGLHGRRHGVRVRRHQPRHGTLELRRKDLCGFHRTLTELQGGPTEFYTRN